MSGATVTITVDGQAVNTTVLACSFIGPGAGDCSNQWRTDTRHLSTPLAPGTHTVTATFRFHADVPAAPGCSGVEGVVQAGRVQTYATSVIVS